MLNRKAIVVVIAFGILASAVWLLGHFLIEAQRNNDLTVRISELLKLIDIPPRATVHETVDAVRIFINDHSQTGIDEAFYAMRGDTSAFAAGVIAHAKDPDVERVHME